MQKISSVYIDHAVQIHQAELSEKETTEWKRLTSLFQQNDTTWRDEWRKYEKPWTIDPLLEKWGIIGPDIFLLHNVWVDNGYMMVEILDSIHAHTKKKMLKTDEEIFDNMKHAIETYRKNEWSIENHWEYDPTKISTFRKGNMKKQWFPTLFAFRTTIKKFFGRKEYQWSCCGAKTRHHPPLHLAVMEKMQTRGKLRESAHFIREECHACMKREEEFGISIEAM